MNRTTISEMIKVDILGTMRYEICISGNETKYKLVQTNEKLPDEVFVILASENENDDFYIEAGHPVGNEIKINTYKPLSGDYSSIKKEIIECMNENNYGFEIERKFENNNDIGSYVINFMKFNLDKNKDAD